MTRRMFSIALLIAVLLMAGASAMRTETRAAPAQQTTQEYVQLTSFIDTSYSGYEVIISGNGRKVAYEDPAGGGIGDIYVADVSTGVSQLIVAGYHDLWGINYDGSKVLTESNADGHVYINGTDVTPCYSDPRISWDACLEPHFATISGDGKYVFIASNSDWFCTPDDDYDTWLCDNHSAYLYRIWRVPIEGGEPQLWVDDDAGLDRRLADFGSLESDHYGSKLAFTWGGLVFVNDQEFPLPEVVAGVGTLALSADGNWLSIGPSGSDPGASGHPCFARACIFTTRTSAANWQFLTEADIGSFVIWPHVYLDINENGWRITTDSWEGLWQVNRDGTGAVNLSDSQVWFTVSLSDNAQNIAFVSNQDLVGNGNSAYQIFALKGPPAPDLSVDDIPLDVGAVTFDGSRFTLPVDVTVRNTGDAGTANIAVRLSDNSGWSETRTIASLAAGDSTVLHLDWDITDLLVAGNGQATVRLTAAADPDDLITELGDLNNSATASLDVDARPRITGVEPTFTLDRAYFLDNETVNNPLRVFVDWNGDLAGNGDPPYGDVAFDLNGTVTEVTGESWGAQHTFDMGSDFQAAFACANNTLRLWAAYPVGSAEFRSLETVLQPTVFPWPGWVEWAITNIPGSDASFETIPEAPLVRYAYHFAYPEEPFEATWTPPNWVPYLGGEEVGILPTQAQAEAEAKSDGVGRAAVSGETGLGLAAVSVQGRLWGAGEAAFTCGESLDLQRAELGFEIQVPIEKEAGLADVIPGIRAAEDWPVVGRLVRWLNSVASVKGTFTPQVEITTEFQEQGGQLQFEQGTGTGAIGAQAELAMEPFEDLTASVYGGGRPYVTIQVPKNPGYLEEVGIDLFYGATLQAWEFEAEYERKVNCHYPGGCSEVDGAGMMAMAAAPSPAWRLIPRDYAGADYARFTAPRLRTTAALQATATTTETLLTNIYPRPEPALAVRGSDNHRLLLYVHDDTNDPQGRGTEIRSLTWNGSAWSGPTALTDDVQPDFNPAVAYDGGGTGVAVWERSALPTGITPTLNITFAQSLEIAAATWNGSAWSTPITLTNDSLMDRAPRLSAGADGSLMALWETSDGTDALGTATHPLTLTYALWDGASWSTPAAALTGLYDVLDVALATYSSTQAALVYAVDADGVLTTTADSDLYYSTFNGASWSGPTRLTNDAITDTTPALAYDSAGRLHLLWLRGGDLVWLEDSWNLGDVQTVRSASTEGGFLGFTLSRAPNGNLALVWQAMDDDGDNLSYAIYDAASDTWGADNTLTGGADVEADHAPAFGSDGTLYAAYRLVTTEFVTRTFTISPTQTFTVTHIPQAGQSDLMFLAHTVGRDLTFEGLTITPTNPAVGQVVTLTAVLRNAGDLAVVSPQVAFYDGTSQIGSTQTLSTLAAGYTTTVSTTWTIPSPAAAHTLKAVADPAGLVAETDETNNEVSLQTTLPDLTVDLLYTDYSTTTITATARIANGGVLAASAPFTVAFRAADPLTGTLLGTVPVTSDLAAGGQVTVTLALTDPLSLAGLGAQLWAIADSGGDVNEADETNNTDYALLPALPDLTLTAGDVAGDGPVVVTVRNAGVVTATAPVLAVRQGGLTGTLVYSETLSTLGPGASVTATISLQPGAFVLWVEADPDNLIAESNEGNNLAVREVEVPRRIYLPLVQRNDGP